MTRLWTLLLGATLVSSPARAQELSPLVKYGKWVLVAGSAAMNYLALQAHNDAEDSFDALESRCFDDTSRCELGPTGAYLDPEIEVFYQTSLHYDRTARGWLVGGQAALAGAAVLFIWEFTQPKGRPENIPFEPEVRSLYRATGLGVRVQF
jgi:hypothetical protein